MHPRLEPDPHSRISASACLKHHWLRREADDGDTAQRAPLFTSFRRLAELNKRHEAETRPRLARRAPAAGDHRVEQLARGGRRQELQRGGAGPDDAAVHSDADAPFLKHAPGKRWHYYLSFNRESAAAHGKASGAWPNLSHQAH